MMLLTSVIDPIIMIGLFIALFIVHNYILNSFGILPKLARAYKTNLTVKKEGKLHQRELFFSYLGLNVDLSKCEYRAWLDIACLRDGLLLNQKKLLNFFPKKALIPWDKISYIGEKRGFLKDRYVYEVELNAKSCYIISGEMFTCL